MSDPAATPPDRAPATQDGRQRPPPVGPERLRLPPPVGPERGAPFTFRFDGREITAHPGESIGAALLAAGIRTTRTTRSAGAPRGLLCGIGSCFDCLVTVEGAGSRRACLAPAEPGAEVASHRMAVPVPTPRSGDPCGGAPRAIDADPPGTSAARVEAGAASSTSTATVAVVGAGPAGMAAAIALAEAGVPVTVLDTYARPGGQYHRTRAPGLEHEPDRRASADPTVAAFAHHLDVGRVVLRSATTTWTATVEDGSHPFVFHLAGVGGGPDPEPATLRAASVVLATGATDRVLPFPGWDLPGVVTAGGAQALLKGQGVRVGERVVVAGSGPFLLPVAAALAAAGTEVAAVAEAQPLTALLRHAPAPWQHRATLTEGAGHAARLLRSRTPFLAGTAVTAARGDGRVEEVTLSRLDADWSPLAGGDRVVAVDAAAVSFGFVPQVGLPALLGCDLTVDPVWGDPVVAVDGHQATTVPGVFAAGEVTGVIGAAGAAAEGALAGLTASHALGAIDTATLRERGRQHRRARARYRDLAEALGAMYVRPGGWVSWLTDDSVVCRCEEVTYATVRHAIGELDATDLRSVKLTTRCGMGRCQGRMCGDAVTGIVARHAATPPSDIGALSTPTVLVPVPLRRLAALVDQAGGPVTSPEPARADDEEHPHAADR